MRKTSTRLVLLLSLAGCGGSTAATTTTPTTGIADRDGDGIEDARDRCIDDAEDVDGHLDDDGCPDLDDDADGIADVCDACPRVAGTGTANGCPAHDLERRVVLTERVEFDAGAATLTERGLTTLVALAASLRAQLHVEHVVVVGLAEGDEPTPDALSTARAERVRAFLVAHGVDPVRLTAQGFGPSDPSPTSSSAGTRRRVAFVVDRIDGVTTHALRDGRFEAVAAAPETRTAPRGTPLCPTAQ